MLASLFSLGTLAASGFQVPHINYLAILPELILSGGALLILLAGSLLVDAVASGFYAAASVLVAGGALAASLFLWRDISRHGAFTAVASSISVDGFSVFFLVLVCSALILTSMIGAGFLRRERIDGPEYYVLALLSGSGAMLMAAAGDLIVIFLGLEILSIALYVLAGMDSRRAESGEAAMKYFVLGAFSSAIFVYGIALTYGATGSTNLAQIAAYLAHNPSPEDGLLLAGVGLLLVGFAFKIAAVPFHMWTPDVYQGSPTPVTGFMASVAKAGGFAALLRVFFDSFQTLRLSWQPVVWTIAVVTLLGGAILALVQRDIKRMLAYSSINHAGFILLGLVAATSSGIAGSLYYLFAYAVIVIGTFGVITFVAPQGDRRHDIASYRGLGGRHPVVAFSLTLLLLAQAGVPFTTGFLSKFYVVSAAVSAHSYALAVIAMVSAAIATFFYLRVVVVMYSDAAPSAADAASASGDVALAGSGSSGDGGVTEPGAVAVLTAVGSPVEAGASPVHIPGSAGLALFVSITVTVLFGVWPQPLIDFAHAAKLLF
ncbi:MAG TPA: NADH-quinone oxidoreductase subunit N [Acidimicrobiales bacterium]|nr:NADH-quinone oxidoreductase subunit N [Acidimicrobiales bacterium]